MRPVHPAGHHQRTHRAAGRGHHQQGGDDRLEEGQHSPGNINNIVYKELKTAFIILSHFLAALRGEREGHHVPGA